MDASQSLFTIRKKDHFAVVVFVVVFSYALNADPTQKNNNVEFVVNGSSAFTRV